MILLQKHSKRLVGSPLSLFPSLLSSVIVSRSPPPPPMHIARPPNLIGARGPSSKTACVVLASNVCGSMYLSDVRQSKQQATANAIKLRIASNQRHSLYGRHVLSKLGAPHPRQKRELCFVHKRAAACIWPMAATRKMQGFASSLCPLTESNGSCLIESLSRAVAPCHP
jgi:hypothetical protein